MRQVSPAELEIVLGLPANSLAVSELGGGAYSFEPPLTPEQEAIAIPLLQNGVADDWVAGPLADWDGFSAWRYSNDEYIALVTGQYGPIVGLIEQNLSNGKVNLTIPLLQQLKDANAVSPVLVGQFLQAADQYNIPQELIDAWLAVLNPQ